MFPMTMKATEVSLPASRRFSLRHFLSALGLGLVTAATPAQAQVHKCVVDGKVSYQAMPCSAGVDAGLKLPGSAGAGNAAASPRMPWTGLKVGMTVAEVQKQVSGLTPPLKPDSLMNGARELLAKEVKVAGETFRAGYYFLKGGLYQVSMTTEPLVRESEEILAMYPKVQAQLLKALGPASGEVPLKDHGSGLLGRTRWDDAAGNNMAWVTVGPASRRGKALLTFGYRPEGAVPFKPM